MESDRAGRYVACYNRRIRRWEIRVITVEGAIGVLVVNEEFYSWSSCRDFILALEGKEASHA